MYYLSYISNTYATKNKLEKAIAAFLEANNREVIARADVNRFKQKIIDGIVVQNTLHPRCKPITASWSDLRPGLSKYDDFHLYLGASILNFHLHQSKVHF